MADPRTIAEHTERHAPLPPGDAERYSGYAVMALPFRSGHVLALRRWPSASLGPGFTSVWLRTPEGRWTLYADAPPDRSCARYFGSAAARSVEAPIDLAWRDGRTLEVRIGGDVGLVWRLVLQATAATRVLNAVSPLVPGPLWRQTWFLGPMGRVAGPLLGAGRIRLHGRVPNGQWFVATPRLLWAVGASSASLRGRDFGPLGPLPRQARLADFWLPQRGIFAVGSAFLEPHDAGRHALPGTGPHHHHPPAG